MDRRGHRSRPRAKSRSPAPLERPRPGAGGGEAVGGEQEPPPDLAPAGKPSPLPLQREGLKGRRGGHPVPCSPLFFLFVSVRCPRVLSHTPPVLHTGAGGGEPVGGEQAEGSKACRSGPPLGLVGASAKEFETKTISCARFSDCQKTLSSGLVPQCARRP